MCTYVIGGVWNWYTTHDFALVVDMMEAVVVVVSLGMVGRGAGIDGVVLYIHSEHSSQET